MNVQGLRILVRGGGDLGSGVVFRLSKAGAKVLVCELEKPLVVRRCVSYAQAIFDGQVRVEDTTGIRIAGVQEVGEVFSAGAIPVISDPDMTSVDWFSPQVIVDARLTKKCPQGTCRSTAMVIGLGPGFTAGENCTAAIETKRGGTLGRVIWSGSPEPDSGQPEAVNGYVEGRVLRADTDGAFVGLVHIGDVVKTGQAVGRVQSREIPAGLDGVVRGLIADGVVVKKGWKVGDLDPRMNPKLAYLISDKALAIGGAALEAVLHNPAHRKALGEG